jgi:hypothetical protein
VKSYVKLPWRVWRFGLGSIVEENSSRWGCALTSGLMLYEGIELFGFGNGLWILDFSGIEYG